MKLTGAQILLKCLEKEGVDVMFGFPGGAVIDIYDEIPRSSVEHILVRHEQGAIHAADGYARATGRVGVCLVTSGPGATNTVTGIATAYADSIPVVIFTGQVPRALIGNDAFQEVDIVGITRPCTKHNYLVQDVKDLARTVKQAFYLARSGRPGPVLVDLPKDVQNQLAEFEYPDKVEMRSYKPTNKPHIGQIRKVVKLLKDARKPLIYSGGGVITSGSHEELTWLSQKLSIPVTSTLMGLGAFPGDDELFLGMLGMHGTYAANMAVNNCDLLLAVGARFDDRVTGKLTTFAPNATIVHIDVDPTSIQKNVSVHVPLVADCKSALAALKKETKGTLSDFDWKKDHKGWVTQVQDLGQGASADLQDGHQGHQAPVRGREDLRDHQGRRHHRHRGRPEPDVGGPVLQVYQAQYVADLRRPGNHGLRLPAAMGAQRAFPDKLVIDIAGDGSIQMCIQEMMTVVCNKLPVKIVILNNGYLGMVRQWQELFYEKNYCATCMDAQPDFVKLAEAYGAAGFRVTEQKDVEKTLREAFEVDKPVIVDIRVEREENVYPMVPAGASLTEMLLV